MTFTIIQTRTTPFAELKDGYLVIKGKSVPFDHPDVYEVLLDRLEVYSENPEKQTHIDFNLSAINAVSKRYLMNTFSFLEELSSKETNLTVNWYYQTDNEDIQEMGEICKSNFDLNIRLRETG